MEESVQLEIYASELSVNTATTYKCNRILTCTSSNYEVIMNGSDATSLLNVSVYNDSTSKPLLQMKPTSWGYGQPYGQIPTYLHMSPSATNSNGSMTYTKYD